MIARKRKLLMLEITRKIKEDRERGSRKKVEIVGSQPQDTKYETIKKKTNS